VRRAVGILRAGASAGKPHGWARMRSSYACPRHPAIHAGASSRACRGRRRQALAPPAFESTLQSAPPLQGNRGGASQYSSPMHLDRRPGHLHVGVGSIGHPPDGPGTAPSVG